MSVDAGVAQWLKDGALFTSATSPEILSAFGTDAAETELMSPFAEAIAAEQEAGRQLAFLRGPLAIEQIDVPGLQAGLVGRPAPILGDRLGYEVERVVFVIGAEEQETIEMTRLTVLRRLA